MNYDQARQIGPEGPAPGKWNWTSMNDGINNGHPYTIAPCLWPDGRSVPPSPLATDPPEHSGRERCDHETQEEAERHRWRFELSSMTPTKIDKDTATELHRCDAEGCPNWADYSLEAPFYISPRHNDLCEQHLNPHVLAALHPFVAGWSSIHS